MTDLRCIGCGEPLPHAFVALCHRCSGEHTPLPDEHRWLCHADGSECPDGCDAAPDPERLRLYRER